MKELLMVAVLINGSYTPVESILTDNCDWTANQSVVKESYKDAFGPDTIVYCRPESNKEVLNARITGYSPQGKKSALGKDIRPGGTAAVSRNCSHLLGKKIYIDQHGVYEVNDLTAEWIHERFEGCTIDLARANEIEAEKVGNNTKRVTVLK